MNSLRPPAAHERPTHKRYTSLLKPIRSSDNSPMPTDRTLKSPLSTTREKKTMSIPNLNSCGFAKETFTKDSKIKFIKHTLTQLRGVHDALQQDHLRLQKDFVKIISKLKEVFIDGNHGPLVKIFDQNSEKIYRLVSELDSAKYSQKKRLEEKDEMIKELQLFAKEKEQESITAIRNLELKKEELRARERHITKMENSIAEIKARFQQDLEKAENERASLEYHYLHEISLLKTDKFDTRTRNSQRTLRDSYSPNRSTYDRPTYQNRCEVIQNELEALRSERDEVSTQFYIEQQKVANLKNDNDEMRKSVDDKQAVIKMLKIKMDSLSEELESSIGLNANIQQLLDEEQLKNNELTMNLEEKKKELSETTRQLGSANEKLEECLTQYEFFIKQAQERDVKKSPSLALKTNRNNLRSDILLSKENTLKMRTSVPTSREASPNTLNKSPSMGTSLRHLSSIFSKEKDMQGRINELEKSYKDQKTKNDALQTENLGILKRLSLRDKECLNLKHELQILKERLRNPPSKVDTNLDLLKNEIKKLQKLSTNRELELNQAKLEIKTLTISKEELEKTLQKHKERGGSSKDQWTDRSLGSKDLTNDNHTRESHHQISIYTDRSRASDRVTPEIRLREVGEDDVLIGEVQTRENDPPKTQMDKSITSCGLIDDEEMNQLRKENYELSVQLSSKDLKLQSLMKLSASTMKALTEEFLRLSSNILTDLNTKVKDESVKWKNFEGLLEQLITRYLQLTSESKPEDIIKELNVKIMEKPEEIESTKNIERGESEKVEKIEEADKAGKVEKIEKVEKLEKQSQNKKSNKLLPQSVWKYEENRSLRKTIEKLLETKSVKAEAKAEGELTRIKTARSRSDAIDINSLVKTFETSQPQLRSPNNNAAKSLASKRETGYSSEKKIKNAWPTQLPSEESSRVAKSLNKLASPKNIDQQKNATNQSKEPKTENAEGAMEVKRFDLQHFLSEMETLKNMVLQKETAVQTLKDTHTSPEQQAHQKQKIFEMFENVLLSDRGLRKQLEGIQEATHETETFQDEQTVKSARRR